MPGSTGENQENPQLGKSLPRPEFEPAIFCIQRIGYKALSWVILILHKVQILAFVNMRQTIPNCQRKIQAIVVSVTLQNFVFGCLRFDFRAADRPQWLLFSECRDITWNRPRLPTSEFSPFHHLEWCCLLARRHITSEIATDQLNGLRINNTTRNTLSTANYWKNDLCYRVSLNQSASWLYFMISSFVLSLFSLYDDSFMSAINGSSYKNE
jgi:hypothetical protein